jgi:hypothetical protein
MLWFGRIYRTLKGSGFRPLVSAESSLDPGAGQDLSYPMTLHLASLVPSHSQLLLHLGHSTSLPSQPALNPSHIANIYHYESNPIIVLVARIKTHDSSFEYWHSYPSPPPLPQINKPYQYKCRSFLHSLSLGRFNDIRPGDVVVSKPAEISGGVILHDFVVGGGRGGFLSARYLGGCAPGCCVIRSSR